MVTKRIVYSRQGSRTLAHIPTNESKRIIAKIEQYAGDPRSQAKNVVKLQGRPGYRLRVGDWRIIFDEDDKVLDFERIASRGSIY